MKKVINKFKEEYRPSDGVSSYIAFHRAVKRSGLKPQEVRKLFDELVDREDYMVSEKELLLEYLYGISKRTRRNSETQK